MPAKSPNTLAILHSQFPGVVRIPVVAAGRALGLAPQTTRNQLVLGTFPAPTERVGGRRYVRIDDLARALDAGAAAAATRKYPSGAPPKAERLAAAAAGLTVPEFRRRQRAEEAASIAQGKGVQHG